MQRVNYKCFLKNWFQLRQNSAGMRGLFFLCARVYIIYKILQTPHCKILFFCIFFPKNLHNIKKSSNFAPSNKKTRTINKCGTLKTAQDYETRRIQKLHRKIRKSCSDEKME